MQAASYAKINLSLEVLGKLPNGYHQIETLFSTIDLADELRFTLTKTPGIDLWSDLLELNTQGNLIYKVASYLEQQFRPCQGIRIELKKRIPIAAGLGGGSSNAAITLFALNKLWDLQLSPRSLETIAASFGSDINFFLQGGTCLGEDRGQKISRMPDILIDKILLVNPQIRISSAEAYKLVDSDAMASPHSYQDTLSMKQFFNRLEPGIRARYPLIDQIIRQMSKAGALAAMMSGSGSTCFGIYEDINALQASRDAFAALGYWTQITKTIGNQEYQKCLKDYY